MLHSAQHEHEPFNVGAVAGDMKIAQLTHN